jgi:hypothetical protein
VGVGFSIQPPLILCVESRFYILACLNLVFQAIPVPQRTPLDDQSRLNDCNIENYYKNSCAPVVSLQLGIGKERIHEYIPGQ